MPNPGDSLYRMDSGGLYTVALVEVLLPEQRPGVHSLTYMVLRKGDDKPIRVLAEDYCLTKREAMEKYRAELASAVDDGYALSKRVKEARDEDRKKLKEVIEAIAGLGTKDVYIYPVLVLKVPALPVADDLAAIRAAEEAVRNLDTVLRSLQSVHDVEVGFADSNSEYLVQPHDEPENEATYVDGCSLLQQLSYLLECGEASMVYFDDRLMTFGEYQLASGLQITRTEPVEETPDA